MTKQPVLLWVRQQNVILHVCSCFYVSIVSIEKTLQEAREENSVKLRRYL